MDTETILTGSLAAVGTAALAVGARLFAQPALQSVIAKVAFRGLHWLARKTTNDLDDEVVTDLEDQYYDRNSGNRK